MNDVQAQRRKDVQEGRARFQPVILVLQDNRLECECGALATFLSLQLNDDGSIAGYRRECHDCYCKEDEK